MTQVHISLLARPQTTACFGTEALKINRLLINNLKILRLERLQLLRRVSTYRLTQIPKSHCFAEIQVFELVVLNYPWEDRILRDIVKATVGYEV